MKTELQYQLQKARALATELRVTLEELGRYAPFDTEEWLDNCNSVSVVESDLDELPTSIIGEGNVALSIEPFSKDATMMCELVRETRHELSQLAYRAWAEAFDILQQVKKEEDDGTPDFASLHAARLEDAKKRVALAIKIRDDICKYSPLTLGQ